MIWLRPRLFRVLPKKGSRPTQGLRRAGVYTHQRGVALLTVLMLVAIITSIAAVMLMREQTMLDRSEAFSRQQQVSALEISSNQWALARLQSDETLLVDSLDEPWLTLSPVTQVGFGALRQQMLDASARVNLNNLAFEGTAQATQVLLQALFLELGLNTDLVFALSDYIDEDALAGEADEVQTYGRALSNQPLVSLNELLQVPGFGPAQLTALKPYVIALPWFTPVNLNTTSPVVLSAITAVLSGEEFSASGGAPSDGLTEDAQPVDQTSADAQDELSAAAQSARETYSEVSGFIGSLNLGEATQDGQNRQIEPLLAVKSSGILLVSSAQLAQTERSWITVFKRTGSEATPIYKLPAFMDDMGVLAQLAANQSAASSAEL